MKYSLQSGIIDKKQLTDDIYMLHILCPEIASLIIPGQFLHIRCGDKTLRRPISVCDCDENSVKIVFKVKGSGTRYLSERKAGDILDIIGPLGNGFELSEYKKVLLVGGGIGIPPLLYLARRKPGTSALLGFRNSDEIILQDEFSSVCKNVTVMTDDGSKGQKGFVTENLYNTIKDNGIDCVCAVGPTVMMSAVAKIADDAGVCCFVSLEERMGCGVGACLTCACKIKRNGTDEYLHVCKDGPVFNASEVVFDG